MEYKLIEIENSAIEESALFLEGAVLAVNMTTKPLEPEIWLNALFAEKAAILQQSVVEQIHAQHNRLLRNEYSVLALTQPQQDGLADFAEGFMSVWPMVEEQWQDAQPNDGTLRMMSAMLTLFMLAIDEQATQQQMMEAGIDQPPQLVDLIDQLDLMVNEVALAADELMVGNKSQSLNPFKAVGRNDRCPCESGKKFKQCCGK